MSASDTTDIVDLIKLYIVNIALIAILLIGVTRLILEELYSLIPLYKKVKASLKQDHASFETLTDLRPLPSREASSELPKGFDAVRKTSE